MNGTLVPFGKYKGQPVEIMQNDNSYCEWLMAQDWFRNKYTNTYQFIVNNFAEPTETPEHNQLQALFLDDEICLRLYNTIKKENHTSIIDSVVNRVVNRIIDDKRNLENSHCYCGLQESEEDYNKRKKTFEDETKESISKLIMLIDTLQSNPIDLNFSEHINDRRFEVNGFDVYYEARLELNFDKYRDWHNEEIFIEIKPSLGDDYPAILRQMKRQREMNRKITRSYDDNYVLLFDNFTAIGASLDNVKKIFNESGFHIFNIQDLTI